MCGWSSSARVSSQLPSHQSASCPIPVTQHLSMRAHQRREPVRVELDQREVQIGVALGDAAADELAHHLLRDHRAVDALRDHPLRRRLLGHRLVDLRGLSP